MFCATATFAPYGCEDPPESLRHVTLGEEQLAPPPYELRP